MTSKDLTALERGQTIEVGFQFTDRVTARLARWAVAIKLAPQAERRQHQRYRVTKSPNVTLALETAGQRVRSLEGSVVDLSRGGAKLSVVTDPGDINETIATLELSAGALAVTLQCQPRWVSWISAGGGRPSWRLGVNIRPELPRAVLEELLPDILLDQSEFPEDLDRRAIIRCDPDRRSLPVEVSEVSASGFCVAGDLTGLLGSEVSLLWSPSVDTSLAIRARYRWRASLPAGDLHGCEFIDPRDGDQLKAMFTFRKSLAARARSALMVLAIFAALVLWIWWALHGR